MELTPRHTTTTPEITITTSLDDERKITFRGGRTRTKKSSYDTTTDTTPAIIIITIIIIWLTCAGQPSSRRC